MDVNKADIVLICGPKLIAEALGVYVKALGKKIQKAQNKRELEDFLNSIGNEVCLSILCNIYPAFNNDMEFAEMIRCLRLKKMMFPIIAIGFREIKSPIFAQKEEGHFAFKFPLLLQDLEKHIKEHRNLESFQWNAIVLRHLKPEEFLLNILKRFMNHDLPKRRTCRQNELLLTDLPNFKKDFSKIYENRQQYFNFIDNNFIENLDNINNYISTQEKFISSIDDLNKSLIGATKFLEARNE